MTGEKAKELILFGIDGAMMYFIKKFSSEGKLPAINSLIATGVLAEALPSPPCDTPTNWTTIATGATTGTHGATSFYVHIPGEKLGKGQHERGRTQLSNFCEAEYLWDVAEKEGWKPLVINYPSGWPGKFKRGMIIAGSWPMPTVPPRVLAQQALYTPDARIIQSSKLELRVAEGWKNIPMSYSNPLEATMQIDSDIIKSPCFLNILVLDSVGKGYDTIFISKNKRIEDDVQSLKRGEWSDWLCMKFPTSLGRFRGFFRIKLLELSPDAKRFSLHCTHVFNAQGWTYPEELGEELIKNTTPYDEGVVEKKTSKLTYVLFGKEATYLQKARDEAYHLIQTIDYLKKIHQWKLCFLHYHLLDGVNHRFLGPMYASCPKHNPGSAEEAMRNFEDSYKIVDKFVGGVLDKCSSDETLVVLVSDHAALPSWKYICVGECCLGAG